MSGGNSSHAPLGDVGRADAAPDTAAPPRVAVVVTTYDHAHFLEQALASIVAQNVPPCEVIVVDDGSRDNPGEVVARFPTARMISQPNAGLAAARNAGLRECSAELVLFLDADDVLCPAAIEAGVEAMRAHPGAAFVYGAYRLADAALQPTSEPQINRFDTSAYHSLLHDNLIGMHASVLYDRALLLESGGFDETLERCEDYDAYLRLAREHPVGSHPEVVALYRMHSANMSGDPVDMLPFALDVHARNKPPAQDRAALRAWRRGRRFLKITHAHQAWKDRRQVPDHRKREQRRQLLRAHPGASMTAAAWQIGRALLPSPAADWIRRAVRQAWLPVGGVDMGNLARTTPISRKFGFDRGTPIDRFYIEQFLAANADAIRGRVLEIGDDHYSRQFGRGITVQDVLHVAPDNPKATIVGDLSQPGVLPDAAFDCLVVTQTLHLIYDMEHAVAQMHRALRPGGSLLVTVPGVSSVERGEWTDRWLWSLTQASAEALFARVFPAGNVAVEAHGNVYAATCFLHGLSLEEVRQEWLGEADPSYPVIVTVRARREA